MWQRSDRAAAAAERKKGSGGEMWTPWTEVCT
ncbi:hypothetical protein E2C01_093575 [Portunus trituberculatus]|uniref:Uncharacterized protein n=1 Tax=Portunus trituberculatus TaxID=210409 RepID=A0A5B7JZ32_PORTR|nr:hypothetical protein [Portunus trituberculatus]